MSTTAGQSLLSRLVRRLLTGHLKMAACLFLPAGSLKFWPGWAYLAASLLSELRSSIYFYRHDPQLLERRQLKKEIIGEQKNIHTLWKMLAALFLMLAGGDYRFGWSRRLLGPVPCWLTVLAFLFMLSGYNWVFLVLRANRFAASIIQVESAQVVIDTGPYRFVRHPFYLGAIVIWFCSPLALGSFVAVPVSFLIIPIIVFRLLNEEKLLCRELPGYAEYCQRTRCRLVPFVW